MTKSQMANCTTQELREYVEHKQAKYNNAPAFIRRNSMPEWKNRSAAIWREIQQRMLAEYNASKTH
jgi:hypothetical protein